MKNGKRSKKKYQEKFVKSGKHKEAQKKYIETGKHKNVQKKYIHKEM